MYSGITINTFGQDSTPSDSLTKVLINKEAEMFHLISTGDRAVQKK